MTFDQNLVFSRSVYQIVCKLSKLVRLTSLSQKNLLIPLKVRPESSIKRIDAMIPSVKRHAVVAAIMDSGAPGLTIAETRGRGSGKRPLVTAARASVRYIAEYNRTDLITIIVDESKVQQVVNAIMNAAHTGKAGDGKIFVSTIEDIYDVATKSKSSL